jgi:hypothetical protein
MVLGLVAGQNPPRVVMLIEEELVLVIHEA